MKVEDSATVVMQFPGGIHGALDLRWNSHAARDQFRVVGTEGEIVLDPLNGPELLVKTSTGIREESLPPHANLHFPAVANFVDSILAGSASVLACTAEQAAWTDWVIEQAARVQTV
jgi:predicted dehydrogenase